MPSNHHHGALIIFGSGPGIGVHVASRFARGGFEKVVLVSRDAVRLRDDAFIVYSNAPRVEVSTVAADLASPADVQRALLKIGDILGDTPVECVHYNAAKASRTTLLEESVDDLSANLEISVIGLYTVAKWAIPRLLLLAGDRYYKPALLVTSGWLAYHPEPFYFAMGVCKAAQQNIIRNLHDQMQSRGVHCALAMVNGLVHPDSDATNPTHIADRCWELYNSRGSGKMELEAEIKQVGEERDGEERNGEEVDGEEEDAEWEEDDAERVGEGNGQNF